MAQVVVMSRFWQGRIHIIIQPCQDLVRSLTGGKDHLLAAQRNLTAATVPQQLPRKDGNSHPCACIALYLFNSANCAANRGIKC